MRAGAGRSRPPMFDRVAQVLNRGAPLVTRKFAYIPGPGGGTRQCANQILACDEPLDVGCAQTCAGPAELPCSKLGQPDRTWAGGNDLRPPASTSALRAPARPRAG